MSYEHKEQLLLTTKFTTPASYFNKSITRPHIYEKLTRGVSSPLTLVTAPAGCGKTTAVCQWLQYQKLEAAWLSLDEADNDPVRFWSYVIAALQKRFPLLGQTSLQLLLSSGLEQQQTALVTLINDLVSLPEEVILVLEGYHVISNSAIHSALVFLLEQCPPSFHLVITTRLSPPFPLARMHVRGLVTELTTSDLRFTLEESTIFLIRTMGLNLSPSEVVELHKYTEGWIAGIQLLALSLQGRDASVALPSFIQQLNGTQRHIFAYLTDEVLSLQPAAVQEFILATSILKRMNSSLCDALTLQSNSQEMLEYLYQANLFVFALDESGEWYRYYHLFANLSGQRLKQLSPELLPLLHLRASEWFEQHDLMLDAVSHACAAKAFKRAASLIERSAWPLIQRGESDMVFSLLKLLPKDLLYTHANLTYLYVLVFFYSGNFDECECAISQVEQTAYDTHDALLLGRSFELRAYYSLIRKDGILAATYALEALSVLPEDEQLIRGSALVALGAGYAHYGDLAAAMQSLSQGYRLCQENQHYVAMQIASAYLATTQYSRGRLHEAEQAFLRLIHDTDTSWHRISLYFRLCRIYSEWNDPVRAQEFCQQGLQLAEQSGRQGSLTEGYMCAALLAQRRGDSEQAKQFLDASLLNMQRTGQSPSLLAHVISMHVYFWLSQGNVALAAHYCDLHMPPEQAMPAEVRVLWSRMRASILIAQGDPADAIPLLLSALAEVESQGRGHAQVEVGILLTMAFQANGQLSEALSSLEKALILAESGGFVSSFVALGSEMALLLSELCSRYQRSTTRDSQSHPSSSYLYSLLAAFDPTEASRAWKMLQENIQAQITLIEKLSERELEVLQQIAAGSTNQDIAQKLVVTVSTIKTHINNIYAKLQVHTRLQAVRKAQDLGLIERPVSRRTGPLIASPRMLSIPHTTSPLPVIQPGLFHP